MKLTKIGEEVTYLKQTKLFTLKINDKEVHYYAHSSYSEYGDDDFDLVIDEDDKKNLTDDELEYLEDNVQDLLIS